MADPGDIVLYYTHEKSDDNHMTVDEVALVLESSTSDEGVETLRLQVFPWGSQPFQTEATPWPDELPKDSKGNVIVGHSFWRDLDSDPPDFAASYESAPPPQKVTV